MSKVLILVTVNTKAYLWAQSIALKNKTTTAKYVEKVLLRHLAQSPGVDLSQSPYSEPKGVSNGEKGRA